MRKTQKNIVLTTAVIIFLLSGIMLYQYYIHKEIYQNNSEQLLATYEQVNRVFTMFCQRNWNVLSDWDGNLQYITDSDDTETAWEEFASRKNNWQYSDFYMFNEDCNFLTASRRKGTADSISNVFQKMYEQNQPIISNYTASSGLQKVVFAVPLSKPFTLDHVTYTGVAVSYDIHIVEDLLAENVYGNKSSCFLVDSCGDIILSLESDPLFPDGHDNLFTYLNEHASFTESTMHTLQQDILNTSIGSAEFKTDKTAYYLVYQPVGINDWSILGIVQTSVVNARDEKLLHLTILMISAMAVCLLFLIVSLFTTSTRLQLKQQELQKQQEMERQRELENLANTDGLTGLFNERYFSSILHERETQRLSFILYYLDLDRFKPINDTYGHDMGDKLLREVAGRLKGCIRRQDYAFRIGGDEFALIMNADMDTCLCDETKARITQSLLCPYEIDGRTLQVGVSCGYAIYPEESEDTSQIRILADRRMYMEKEANHARNSVSSSSGGSGFEK